jgi:ASC-1-like (ASCH) protein
MHELKIIEPYFTDVLKGIKTFEVRKNDRNFKVGDIVKLRKYDADTLLYSGEEILVEIKYILDDTKYCKDGYVIFGFDSIIPS